MKKNPDDLLSVALIIPKQHLLMLSSRIRGLNSCLDRSGRVDLNKYGQWKRQKSDSQQTILSQTIQRVLESGTEEDEPKPRSPRTVKRHPIKYRDHEGILRDMTPQMSLWYCLYVNSPNLACAKFNNKFRRCFRMPFANYMEILSWVKSHELFQRWLRSDCCKSPPSPIELLVLGSLRYLGRGWTFDDLEELTCINEETHRQFSHRFIEFGGSYLYNRFVKEPTEAGHVQDAMEVYALAGLSGCCTSSDGTHVGLENCSHYLAQAHTASKLPMPARTYNLSVTHGRLIMSTTTGHPAKWNDKTLQLFDPLLKQIYTGDWLQDVTFYLLERTDEGDEGDTFQATYSGVWCLVDNGYIQWPTTIPPMKQPGTFQEQRWSKWMESMRKDVECTFGIMKGQFRLLKTGLRLHSITSCDRVWMTCCALHNYLLHVDGLANDGTGGSVWLGSMGDHEPLDRLHHPVFQQDSAMDPANFPAVGNDGPSNNPYINPSGSNTNNDKPPINKGKTFKAGDPTTRVVRELSFQYFREQLVEHFDILFERDEIVWPKQVRQGEQAEADDESA